MKQHLIEIFERHDYPAEARVFLLDTVDTLFKIPKFAVLVETFYTDSLENGHIDNVLDEVANETGIHEYTVKFIYYLCVTKEMREEYAKKGINEEIYWDTVNDFRYKLDENKKLHDIWGFQWSSWFYPFLILRQFKLGRLEFTMNSNYWNFDFEICGKTVTKGMPVLHIHIPSAKEAFSKEACYDSYDKAYHFFKEVMGYEYECFCCGSWLLSPDHKVILSEKSNIARFSDDFKIVNVTVPEDPRHDLWRIFYKDAQKPYEELPRETSLQKAYAEFLCGGGVPREGFGAFIWDPVNKCPVK